MKQVISSKQNRTIAAANPFLFVKEVLCYWAISLAFVIKLR